MAKIAPAVNDEIISEPESIQSNEKGMIQISDEENSKKTPNEIITRSAERKIGELQENRPVIDQKFDNGETDIRTEDQKMANQAEERHQHYQDILQYEEESPSPYYYGFYGFFGMAAGIALNMHFLLIPYHDTIKDPSYFYEYTLYRILVQIPVYSVVYVWEFAYIMNTDRLRNIKTCAKVAVGLIISNVSLRVLINLLWIILGGNRYPMPFHSMVYVITQVFIAMILLWFQCPKKWRVDKKFQRRFVYFIWIKLSNILIYVEYLMFFKTMLRVTPQNWQWVVPLAFPVARELNTRWQMMLSYKSANSKQDSVGIFREHYNSTQHNVFLSAAIGSDMTDLSMLILIGADAFINFYYVAKLIWMKRRNKIGEKIDDARNLLISLMVNEIVEFVTAVSFLVCLLIAYFGPNSTLLGNVKSTHFHYEPISDIYSYVSILCYLVIVDIACILITGASLWFFARVNILRANAFMQKDHWIMMTANTAYWMLNHFGGQMVDNAIDLSFEFQWLQPGNTTTSLVTN